MRLGLLSTFGSMLLAVPATADATAPATGAVRLAWVRADAAQDCLSSNELQSELIERMGKDPFEGAPRQWIEGFVTRQGEHYEVQLFERDANGKTVGSRKLSETSMSCRSLDEPIVLAIALIIDPNVKLRQRTLPAGATTLARSAPQPAAPASHAPPDQALQTEPPRVTAPTTYELVPPSSANTPSPMGNATTSASVNTASQPSDQESKVVASTRERRLHDAPTKNQSSDGRASIDASKVDVAAGATELQAGAGFVHGLLPRTAFGVELGSRVARERYALALLLRWFPEQRTEQHGEFGFGATEFGLDACYRLAWHRLHWTNCVEFGAGAIHVTVHRPVPLEPGDRLTASVGANTGLGLSLIGPLSLDARLLGALSLNPWEFRVLDSQRNAAATVFQQSLLMVGGSVDLALRVF
ncbi:MAG TPA: hypothetical protein VIV60_28115 [Polyangiaceae bacterium]